MIYRVALPWPAVIELPRARRPETWKVTDWAEGAGLLPVEPERFYLAGVIRHGRYPVHAARYVTRDRLPPRPLASSRGNGTPPAWVQ